MHTCTRTHLLLFEASRRREEQKKRQCSVEWAGVRRRERDLGGMWGGTAISHASCFPCILIYKQAGKHRRTHTHTCLADMQTHTAKTKPTETSRKIWHNALCVKHLSHARGLKKKKLQIHDVHVNMHTHAHTHTHSPSRWVEIRNAWHRDKRSMSEIFNTSDHIYKTFPRMSECAHMHTCTHTHTHTQAINTKNRCMRFTVSRLAVQILNSTLEQTHLYTHTHTHTPMHALTNKPKLSRQV